MNSAPHRSERKTATYGWFVFSPEDDEEPWTANGEGLSTLQAAKEAADQALAERYGAARAFQDDLALNVVREVQQLCASGYDGPFMGEIVEPLFMALREWETAEAKCVANSGGEHAVAQRAAAAGWTGRTDPSDPKVGRRVRTKEELRSLPIGTRLACEEDPDTDVDRAPGRFSAFFTLTGPSEWRRDDGQFTPVLGLDELLGRLFLVHPEGTEP